MQATAGLTSAVLEVGGGGGRRLRKAPGRGAACGGVGAGLATSCAGGAVAGAALRSSSASRRSSRCNCLPTSMTLMSATMAMTGKASTASTIRLMKGSTIEAAPREPHCDSMRQRRQAKRFNRIRYYSVMSFLKRSR